MTFAILAHLFSALLDLVGLLMRSEREKAVEIALLRQQIRILHRTQARPPRLTWWEKLPLTILAAKLIEGARNSRARLHQSVLLFSPETVLRWHRELVRRKCTFPFRGPACRTTFSARRHPPLYRLKTPTHQIAMVLSALAEGLDPSAAERVSGYRQATITTWLTRAGQHAQTLHERSFCHLHLPHLQLDELRTRLRCATQVLWLWLAIDPCTKILPALHLGPRTQHMAHRVIHSLRQLLAAFLHTALYERRVTSLLLRAHSAFWTLAPAVSPRAQSPPVAGGDGLDLRPGEKMLPATQAGSGDPPDAPLDTSSSHGRLTEDRSFGTIEHCLHRASQSHGSSRNSSSGTSNLGHFPTDLTASGSPRVVASLFSLCAPS